MPLPAVATRTEGARAQLRQLTAALAVEFRLLSAERGLVVIVALAVLLCVAGVALYEVAPDVSYSASYAARTAESLLLFLFAVAIFFAGEALHRDRELRIEPVLWAAPAPNFVLLLSKFASTVLLSVALMALVGAAAVALQLFKGHGPVEPAAYLTTYSVILLPSAIFMVAAAFALNVLLRDKYAAYAACLAAGGGLFYLFSVGRNHPLYNFILYQLWTPASLFGAEARVRFIFTHRAYVLALAALCLSLAHLLHARKSSKGFRTGGRLNGRAWSLLSALASAAAAVACGLAIS